MTRFGAKCAALHGLWMRARWCLLDLHVCTNTVAELGASVLSAWQAWSAYRSLKVVPCRATKASQAQSRMKQLEKLREAAIPLPAASSGAGPGDGRKV